MNNKGQALVEFVIIMPVFIFAFLAVFDMSNIIFKKYSLENELDTVVSMYENGNEIELENYVKSINAKVKYENNANYNEITLSKKVNVITPIINNIFGKFYEISSRRMVALNDKIE